MLLSGPILMLTTWKLSSAKLSFATLQMSDPIAIGSWIGANVLTLIGILMGMQRALKAKDDKLAQSKMETIQVLESNRDAWKAKYEDEHNDYKSYRDYTHQQLSAANNKILQVTEENSQLRIKTDMAPVLEALGKITQILNAMMDKLGIATLQDAHQAQHHH